MKKYLTLLCFALICLSSVAAVEFEPLPADPYFEPFKPVKAPAGEGAVLRQGDRLAICGDSITEQKMYSRIMETYLTVCVPQLDVTVRQFGWSGERAPGFYHRMANDVLRFKPTVATTCYGMNDHRYQPFTEEIGREYRDNALAIIKDAVGSLDRVQEIVQVRGFVNSAPGFFLQPRVMDGASELLLAVFGERGHHVRCALGTSSLPNNIPVEIEMIVALRNN